MTAEIVIMNKHGVALAADSAVSVGTQKVYNTANKLFSLSKSHPVGIMIYGNAAFMGIPWETIIKKYRKDHLQRNSFDTLKEYSDDFLNYLATSDIISDKTEDFFIKGRITTITKKMILVIRNAFQDFFENTNTDITNEIRDEITKKTIKNLEEDSKKHEKIHGLPATKKTSIRQKYKDHFLDALAQSIEKFPITDEDQKNLLKIAFNYLFSTLDFGLDTGVVIAGFGDDEIFPKTEDIKLSGKIGEYLIITNSSSQRITIGMGASVAPYAQREMVDTIMKGIDPVLEREILSQVQEAIDKLPAILAEKYNLGDDGGTKAAIENDTKHIKDSMLQAIRTAQRDHYVRPVIDSVAILPLPELASMAEALINITSFKRRVTMVSESVGGPIDVALISKGDGFVWIKRKHYFSPDLNRQYFINQGELHGQNS